MKMNLEDFINMKKQSEGKEKPPTADMEYDMSDDKEKGNIGSEEKDVEKNEEGMDKRMPFGEYMKHKNDMKGRSGLAIFIQTGRG